MAGGGGGLLLDGDVLAGVVSIDAARTDYGVVVDTGGTVDIRASEALRAVPRGEVLMFHRNRYFGPLVQSPQ